MIATASRQEVRIHTLDHLGVEPAYRDELLERNQSVFCFNPAMQLAFPWADEPFVPVWERYALAVREQRSLAALQQFLVQLRFPVRQGISGDRGYVAVTRKGAPPALFAPGAAYSWKAAERGFVFLHPTAAGRISYIFAAEREDFVFLVRALSHRNEPVPVPDSMGACVVSGYNNWDRIESHRAVFVAEHGAASWPAEMGRIARERSFQDSFLILSGGPYSGVPAQQMGLGEAEWLNLSLRLRQSHEAAHYFTRRVLGSARNHVGDEAIADFFAITQVFPIFDGVTFLRFFGLEQYPHYRPGGRLQNYRGVPPLSDGAFAGLQRLLFLVAENLENLDASLRSEFRQERNQAAVLLTLCQFTIEEMAASGFGRRFQSSFRQIQKLSNNRTESAGAPPSI